MSANIFGNRLKMISFGESHGPAYGVVIEGFPAGVSIDLEILKNDLAKRRPGQNQFVTARAEADEPEILSGIYLNQSLGTPIAVIVKNTNQQSNDYNEIEKLARIGHADDTWKNKFKFADHRGGGRSSGRETLNRVIAGSFAKMYLNQIVQQKQMKPIQVKAYPIQVGEHILKESDFVNSVWPIHIQNILQEAKHNGESYGGIIECRITQAPSNLGQPVFHKFKSDLAQAILSIGATTGFEFGSGFQQVHLKGSDYHQNFESKNYGGIRGGITTGEEIVFKVVFKPTSSIKDVAKKGRHDPCILPRAIPVVEAMVNFVLADHMMWTLTDYV